VTDDGHPNTESIMKHDHDYVIIDRTNANWTGISFRGPESALGYESAEKAMARAATLTQQAAARGLSGPDLRVARRSPAKPGGTLEFGVTHNDR
jgi:hypothetical protein